MNAAQMGGAPIRRHASKADAAEHTGSKRASKARVVFGGGDAPVTAIIGGRMLWALRALIAAGAKGVTPIERPAPRWSAYVHKLRRLGLVIETIPEEHGGAFPGTHGRYVLRSVVAIGGGA
jgi:thiamine monophosphate synthase